MSESGYPGLKDEQDKNRDLNTYYQLPVTRYQSQLDN
jgi:hypothetical protein